MTLEWVARFALALWIVYAFAFHAEGHKPRGSGALQTLNTCTEITVLTALVWAGWWA